MTILTMCMYMYTCMCVYLLYLEGLGVECGVEGELPFTVRHLSLPQRRSLSLQALEPG